MRLLLIAIMLASLLMAVAIPEAFGDRALLFAGSYVAIQVGRHLFLTFVAADAGTIERERAGAHPDLVRRGGRAVARGRRSPTGRRGPCSGWWRSRSTTRAPLVLYWVPGRRAPRPTTWEVETSHFAERFQLFIIIALGESIVITGATTAELELDAGAARRVRARVLWRRAALWWLYFNYVAAIAQRRLELAGRTAPVWRATATRTCTSCWSRGSSSSAVGDELVIAHPTEVLPGRGGRGARGRPGAVPARARPVPAADGGLA